MANILVIDDNDLNLCLIRDMLSASGHVVYTANSGKSALEMAPSLQLDLVLTDIQMPEISGIDVMKNLKSHPDYQGIPIVAVTAHTMQGDEVEFLNAGFDGYLSKPLTFNKLLDVVNKYF